MVVERDYFRLKHFGKRQVEERRVVLPSAVAARVGAESPVDHCLLMKWVPNLSLSTNRY